MSGNGADGEVKHHGEIIIVRRGGDHEEGHHGGVWKIAFADFMTAMMCFFLVMWLINAANEQTKASVASYFNPVKLVDRNTAQKGLDDSDDSTNATGSTGEKPTSADTRAGSEGEATGGPADNKVAAEIAESPEHSDTSLFADPYAVLAEIAAETGAQQNMSEKGDGGAQDSGPATGASGGEAYRDPFAPDFWTQQMTVPSLAEASAERSAPAGEAAEPGDSLGAQEGESGETSAPAEASHAETAPPSPEAAPPKPEPRPEQAPPSEPEAAEKKPDAATEKAAAEIRHEIAEKFKPGDEGAKEVSVAATNKGVVIEVTEGLDFGMFEIGSAVPESALVHAMDKIGAAIKARGGTITIQGHTDGRPFRSDKYDNWRLSTARAHAAYYMLLRAGLDEKRVVEVAGLADRKPKIPGDPLSAANRRIEILLEVPQ